MKINSQLDFLRSAFCTTGILHDNQSILNWIKLQTETIKVNIEKCPITELDNWSIIEGSIKHNSGKFFSIDGINVSTNWGTKSQWSQPIINQPEIGFLGFITKNISGVLHFLMQAKVEPGNINYVQLSPTLQATRSNYTQIHKGKKPHYLDYFLNVKNENVILDQLQSEQGARFLKKRNRNIIIKVDEEIKLEDNFIWLTLGQIKELMLIDNVINMDTRTVISGITFGSINNDNQSALDLFLLNEVKDNVNFKFLKSMMLYNNSYHSNDQIIRFITNIKSNYDLDITKINIEDIIEWTYNGIELVHNENKYFKVIGVNVSIENREISKWSQPMIEPCQEGICAFICKEINNTLHFIVQAKLECGNHDVIELAPTVQCLTGGFKNFEIESIPFLKNVLYAKPNNIYFDSLQSEEGGRFYREQNRNLIVIDEEINLNLPDNYVWMTLNQLCELLKYNNFLNIQARSLISAIRFS